MKKSLVVQLTRACVVAGLLAANSMVPVQAKPACWDCANCSDGACCPEAVFGHTGCTPNEARTACEVTPGPCPH